MTGGAFHHGVSKAVNMATGPPDLGMHHDTGIYAYNVIPLLNRSFPPGILNIALKLHSHRAVVPAASQATVYFAAGKDKPSSLAQRNNFLHIYPVRHFISP
jgi:hypothetical protein